MKIGIVSLGCCKNLVDSQNIMTTLKAAGHTFTDNPKNADVIVINTCGFINDAKEESINTILQMADYKEENCKYLIVTGCLVQRYQKELEKELPEVDLWIPIRDYGRIDKILNEFLHSKKILPEEVVLATKEYTAYLRIADGCSNKCAYCAIPLIRGEYRSEPIESLIEQARKLEAIGVKELNLIAQDTTRYGIDLYGRLRLADLLTELNQMNFKWIRILYMYPDEITDELLDTMAKCEKVVPYFDIPTQHANNRMLKLMNRRGSKEHILTIIDKIKSKFPDPVLRTTLIVGFPTETEAEFEEMVDFLKVAKWDRMGAFTYSIEEDTSSYTMEPKVDEDIAKERLDRLMAVQQQIAQEKNEQLIGQVLEVLVEKNDAFRKNLFEGRSKYDAPDGVDGHVRFTSQRSLKPGEFVRVLIEGANIHDLSGKEVE